MISQSRYILILLLLGCLSGGGYLYLRLSQHSIPPDSVANVIPTPFSSNVSEKSTTFSPSVDNLHNPISRHNEIPPKPSTKQSVQDREIAWLDDENQDPEIIENGGQLGQTEESARLSQEELINVLNTPFQESGAKKDELDRAVQEYARLGEAGLDGLLKEYYKTRAFPEFRSRAIEVLARVNTPRAKKELLSIAMGDAQKKTAPNEKAAQAYLSMAKTKTEISLLLTSTDEGILNKALLSLKGFSLDAELLRKMAIFLDSRNMAVRLAAIDVIEHDPSEMFSKAKVDMLLDGISKTDRLPSADSIYQRSNLTCAEFFNNRYVNALSNMGAQNEVLLDAMKRSRGIAHDALAIALLKRGDLRAKDEVVAILQSQQSNMIHVLGISALGDFGTSQELPLLRKISESNTFVREQIAAGRNLQYYPIRQAAQSAIATIQSREH